jgi:hypothetical protein
MESHTMKRILCALALGMGSLMAAPDELWIAAVQGQESGPVDSTLKSYLSVCRESLHLSGLKLIDTEKEPLEPGQGSVAKFKGGYTIEVQCLKRQPTRYLVSLTLADREGPLLETRAAIARNSPMILAGPSSLEGRLFFLVLVR